MCGIAGIFNFADEPVPAAALDELLARILHRGPDDSGTHASGNVGLAHSRLSILDLSPAGHQPMIDPATRGALCYNGEIYNFRVLREQLAAEGVDCRSTGDTEVLLRACLHWGVEKTLPRLNGMFAFAFWDEQRRELWLARDRMGIKPLYYHADGKRLVFASEIKALLPTLNAVRPDLPVLFDVLSGGTACEPYTLFDGVRALDPGHFLRLRPADAAPVQREYFSIFDPIDPSLYAEYLAASPAAMSERFGDLMNASVEIHAISDAPVATLASGGVDSSLISALTRHYCEGLTLYHADVVGENSERVHAQRVATHLGLELVTAELTPASYIDNLVETTWYHETPSAYHPNDVPFQLISARAHRDGIKVFLTGEGADELFIGYGHASKHILRNKIRIFGQATPGVRTVGRLIAKLYPGAAGASMIERLSSRARLDQWERRAREAYAFVDSEIERVALISSAVYQKVHLNSLLQRNDRMGMMHALESRIPFLENDVHRFAMNLPAKFKHPVSWRAILAGNPLSRNKIVVREAAKRHVPESITRRKKLGFPITPEHYLRLDGDFFADGFLEQALGIGRADLRGIVDGVSGDERWNLFSTELFGRMYFLGEDRAALAERIAGYAVAS